MKNLQYLDSHKIIRTNLDQTDRSDRSIAIVPIPYRGPSISWSCLSRFADPRGTQRGSLRSRLDDFFGLNGTFDPHSKRYAG